MVLVVMGLGAMQALAKKPGEQYSISHAWANDLDKDSCETYRQNIAQGPDICRDVKQLKFSNTFSH